MDVEKYAEDDEQKVEQTDDAGSFLLLVMVLSAVL